MRTTLLAPARQGAPDENLICHTHLVCHTVTLPHARALYLSHSVRPQTLDNQQLKERQLVELSPVKGKLF